MVAVLVLLTFVLFILLSEKSKAAPEEQKEKAAEKPTEVLSAGESVFHFGARS